MGQGGGGIKHRNYTRLKDILRMTERRQGGDLVLATGDGPSAKLTPADCIARRSKYSFCEFVSALSGYSLTLVVVGAGRPTTHRGQWRDGDDAVNEYQPTPLTNTHLTEAVGTAILGGTPLGSVAFFSSCFLVPEKQPHAMWGGAWGGGYLYQGLNGRKKGGGGH